MIQDNQENKNISQRFFLKPLKIAAFLIFIFIVYIAGFIMFAGEIYHLFKEHEKPKIPVNKTIRHISDSPYAEKLFYVYMENLQKKIKANWYPVKDYGNKRIVVMFKVDRNGKLLNLKILKSSNNQKQDKIALEAVKKSAPFDPLPAKYKEKDVDIQFTFDYKPASIKNIYERGKNEQQL